MNLINFSILLFFVFVIELKGKNVKDTKFSIDRGYFDNPFNVTISCATPGSKILYTVDNSIPSSEENTIASKGSSVTITINKSTVLRAIAIKEGWNPSNIDTQTYIFRDQILNQKFPDNLNHEINVGMKVPQSYQEELMNCFLKIPSVSVVMNQRDLFGKKGIYLNTLESGKKWEKPASFEWIDPKTNRSTQVNCAIQIQGQSSRNDSLKQNFRISFKKKYGKSNLAFPLFGKGEVEKFDSIILRNPNFYVRHNLGLMVLNPFICNGFMVEE